jgi:hypothetical protein
MRTTANAGALKTLEWVYLHLLILFRFSCSHCDFTSPRIDKLKEHLLKVHGVGTPPERRVRVTDMVADSVRMVGSLHPDSGDAAPEEEDAEPVDQKPIERYIIEIEADGQTQQLEISPAAIMVDSSGQHVLSAQNLAELSNIGGVVEFANTSHVMSAEEELEDSQEPMEDVHYTEVLVPSDEVIPLVHDVTLVEDN